MDRYVASAFDLIDEFDTATSAPAVMAKFADWLSGFGFESFLITRLPVQNRTSLDPFILLNNWPAGWDERYREAGHYRHDPCVQQCFSALEPFAWTELPPHLIASSRARQIMGEAADFGLARGLCVPFHDDHGFPAVVTMAGQHVDLPNRARRMVHLVSIYAYNAVSRQTAAAPTDADGLSEREREVLDWTSEGKTSWETGQILDISEHTVNAHLRNIRRKLGTANNVHSAVEGLRRHEISLWARRTG